MRFSDGIWVAKEGVKIFSAVEVGKLQTSIDDNSEFWHPFRIPNPGELKLEGTSESPFLRALCHTKKIVNPGGTLGTPTITLDMTSPMDGVISCEAYHYRGGPALKPARAELFPIAAPSTRKASQASQVSIDVDGDTLVRGSMTSNDQIVAAAIDCRPDSFRVDFSQPGKGLLTSITSDSLQWILHSQSPSNALETEYSVTTGSDPYYRAPTTARKGFMSVALSLKSNEKIYGLGERFGPFIKNGQSVELTNGDGGTSTYVGYKNIPFYLSSAGYGVFFDHTETLSLEVQSGRMTKVQTSILGERLRFNIIAGDSPKEILERYTFMTGRAPVPPDWSFGLWLSTSFLTKYDEATVTEIIDRMEKEDIPLSVWHFDCFWSPAHEWCSFRWDPYNFPDPAGFLKRIHNKGIKVCVWINPYVAQESRLFEEGDRKGYFIKRTNGATFQTDDWQAGLAFVDFTNPEAVKWWQSFLEDLMDTGVDSFKTDFGEKIPVDDVVFHDGSDPKSMRNQYTFLYNKAVQDVMIRKRGIEEACLFARSGTVGSQRLPVHWGGDCDSEWTGMAESLRGGLSLALSGFAYWAHDIGGFKGEGAAGGYAMVTPAADVYKRWVPFGLLSSHSRLHGSGSYRVPWLFGEEACRVLSKFTKLKHRLEPYILDLALHDAVLKGYPLLRPMLFEFPQDHTCWHLDMQYMLGDKLLVAPVFDPQHVDYFVPQAGAPWINILNGESKEGGRWYSEDYDMLNLPLLLRPEGVLVMGRDGHRFGQDIHKAGLTLLIPDSIQQKTSTVVHLRNCSITATVAPTRNEGRLSLSVVVEAEQKMQVEVFVIGNGVGLNDVDYQGPRRIFSEQLSCELSLDV